MKLLFDQNISDRLVETLESLHPGSSHVKRCHLDTADDEAVWKFAREHDYTIVSKDSDFLSHCFLRGFPPKVIWIRLGNCSTARVEQALTEFQGEIEAFDRDRIQALLVIP